MRGLCGCNFEHIVVIIFNPLVVAVRILPSYSLLFVKGD